MFMFWLPVWPPVNPLVFIPADCPHWSRSRQVARVVDIFGQHSAEECHFAVILMDVWIRDGYLKYCQKSRVVAAAFRLPYRSCDEFIVILIYICYIRRSNVVYIISIVLLCHWNCLESRSWNSGLFMAFPGLIPFTETGTPQFLWICSRLEESFVSEGYSSWPLEFQWSSYNLISIEPRK